MKWYHKFVIILAAALGLSLALPAHTTFTAQPAIEKQGKFGKVIEP